MLDGAALFGVQAMEVVDLGEHGESGKMTGRQ